MNNKKLFGLDIYTYTFTNNYINIIHISKKRKINMCILYMYK